MSTGSTSSPEITRVLLAQVPKQVITCLSQNQGDDTAITRPLFVGTWEELRSKASTQPEAPPRTRPCGLPLTALAYWFCVMVEPLAVIYKNPNG
jgi:hypothetical protein